MFRWMLAGTITLGLLGSSGAMVAARDTDDDAPASPRTNVHYFLPFAAGELSPTLEVTAEETGDCDHTSLDAAARPDAWRCYPGGGVLDPCFENPFGDVDQPAVLACSSSPFATDIISFTTAAPLPRDTDKADGTDAVPLPDDVERPDPLPWALELANGERRVILSGATQVFAGMRVNYGCEGQGSVIGEVDESDTVWLVQYLAPDGVATELVEVRAAWF